MIKLLRKIFNKRTKRGNLAPGTVSHEAMEKAYKERQPEIESLRKYDRGEKEIHPSNLKNVVRSL